MPDSHTPRDGVRLRPNPVADVSKMSLWTVVGAIAASVFAAAILGGASGIMQIPTLSAEVASLRTSRDELTKTLAERREANLKVQGQMNERLKGIELTIEANQRWITNISGRLDTLVTQLDKRTADDRTQELQTQRDSAATESRNKDRYTEIGGQISGLRSSVDGLADRQRQTADSVAALRQNVYDLATRPYMRGNQQIPQVAEAPSSSPSPMSPFRNSSDH